MTHLLPDFIGGYLCLKSIDDIQACVIEALADEVTTYLQPEKQSTTVSYFMHSKLYYALH